ncbi:MAG: DUF427 domain-containing protein [Gammaproteobacteria bacterium]|nr:DUF427 domain-containing protein [Gammaproteobacteria bacterium]
MHADGGRPGSASDFGEDVAGDTDPGAAWSYPLQDEARAIKDHLAFRAVIAVAA